MRSRMVNELFGTAPKGKGKKTGGSKSPTRFVFIHNPGFHYPQNKERLQWGMPKRWGQISLNSYKKISNPISSYHILNILKVV